MGRQPMKLESDNCKKPVAMFDLFAGGGGAAEGALMAGAIVPLAWECWFEKNKETGEYEVTPHQPALDVHAANHPETKVRQVAIGVNPEWEVTILRKWFAAYRARGYHIHLHGSPPCQALSQASTRNADEGMPLVNHYLWLVKQTEPDSWSMENVVPTRKRLPEWANGRILNSADFGVPQTRRRCFAGEGWIASPTHTKEEWVSVLEALPHLEEEFASLVPVPSMTEQYKHAHIEKPYPTVTSQSPKQLKIHMDGARSKGSFSGKIIDKETGKRAWRDLPPISRPITDPSYTIMSSPRRLMVNMSGGGESMSKRMQSVDADIDGPSKTVCGAVGAPTFRVLPKLEALGSNAKRHQDRSIDEPSKTICGSGNQCGPRIFDHNEPKAQKLRSLTIQETATLQGFRQDYDWSAAAKQKYRWTIIGNAVAPPVMGAVIRGIQHGTN